MRSRRILAIAVTILVLLAIAAGMWWFWVRTNPPDITRMLPDSDSVAYANVGLIRSATHFDEKWDIEHDAGYEAFSQATGIQVSRDLDEVALAIANEGTERRFSEVMRGKFDRAKLETWLKANASTKEDRSGTTIYTVVHEGRPDRIAIVDAHTVIGSNTNDAAPMHAMLERLQHPQTSELLKSNYAAVPKASPVWWIGRFASGESPSITMGDQTVGLGMPSNTVIVASLRYIASLEARALAITPSEHDAERTASNWNSVLHLARSLARLTKSQDPWTKTLSSAQVTQQGPNVSVSVNIPRDTLEALAKSWKDSAQR